MIRNFINSLKGDKVIWLITLFYIVFSLLTVYSFVPILVKIEGGTPFQYLSKHALYVLISVVTMYYVLKLPPIFFKRIAPIFFILSIALLAYTFLFGQKINNAGRWISIPFVSLTFQTSDLAKLALILQLGYLLDKKNKLLNSWKEGFLPIAFTVLLVVGLIFKDNFSTSFLILLIATVLMFIGEVPIMKIASLYAIIIGFASLAVLTQKTLPELNLLPRLETWENRIYNRYSGEAEQDADYIIKNAQAKNAELGIYNGGVIGKGPGNGKVKEFVPEAYADFFYASYVEEFGSIGAFLIIAGYLILFLRMVRISIKAEKIYERVVVMGIGLFIVAQALVNMFVCTGIIPVTGQNMPLLAMGGSAMVMTCVGIAIVQGIAAKYQKEEKVKANEESSDTEISETQIESV